MTLTMGCQTLGARSAWNPSYMMTVRWLRRRRKRRRGGLLSKILTEVTTPTFKMTSVFNHPGHQIIGADMSWCAE